MLLIYVHGSYPCANKSLHVCVVVCPAALLYVFIGYMSLDFLLYWASQEANFNVVLALAESSSCDMFLEQREDLKQSMFQLR